MGIYGHKALALIHLEEEMYLKQLEVDILNEVTMEGIKEKIKTIVSKIIDAVRRLIKKIKDHIEAIKNRGTKEKAKQLPVLYKKATTTVKEAVSEDEIVNMLTNQLTRRFMPDEKVTLSYVIIKTPKYLEDKMAILEKRVMRTIEYIDGTLISGENDIDGIMDDMRINTDKIKEIYETLENVSKDLTGTFSQDMIKTFIQSAEQFVDDAIVYDNRMYKLGIVIESAAEKYGNIADRIRDDENVSRDTKRTVLAAGKSLSDITKYIIQIHSILHMSYASIVLAINEAYFRLNGDKDQERDISDRITDKAAAANERW